MPSWPAADAASFCLGKDGELQLWFCNSSAAPVFCDAEVTIGRFSAAPDLVAGVATEVPPGQSTLAWSIPSGGYVGDPGSICLGTQTQRRIRP